MIEKIRREASAVKSLPTESLREAARSGYWEGLKVVFAVNLALSVVALGLTCLIKEIGVRGRSWGPRDIWTGAREKNGRLGCIGWWWWTDDETVKKIISVTNLLFINLLYFIYNQHGFRTLSTYSMASGGFNLLRHVLSAKCQKCGLETWISGTLTSTWLLRYVCTLNRVPRVSLHICSSLVITASNLITQVQSLSLLVLGFTADSTCLFMAKRSDGAGHPPLRKLQLYLHPYYSSKNTRPPWSHIEQSWHCSADKDICVCEPWFETRINATDDDFVSVNREQRNWLTCYNKECFLRRLPFDHVLLPVTRSLLHANTDIHRDWHHILRPLRMPLQ